MKRLAFTIAIAITAATAANAQVGINTENPTATLHVVGDTAHVKGNALRIVDGNQANRRILVSDANGTARWMPNLARFSHASGRLLGTNANDTVTATNFLGLKADGGIVCIEAYIIYEKGSRPVNMRVVSTCPIAQYNFIQYNFTDPYNPNIVVSLITGTGNIDISSLSTDDTYRVYLVYSNRDGRDIGFSNRVRPITTF